VTTAVTSRDLADFSSLPAVLPAMHTVSSVVAFSIWLLLQPACAYYQLREKVFRDKSRIVSTDGGFKKWILKINFGMKTHFDPYRAKSSIVKNGIIVNQNIDHYGMVLQFVSYLLHKGFSVDVNHMKMLNSSNYERTDLWSQVI